MAKTKTKQHPLRTLGWGLVGVCLLVGIIDLSAPDVTPSGRLTGVAFLVTACIFSYQMGRTYRA